MSRILQPYLPQTYLPTALIVVVSWGSFLIPFDSYPGRAGLLAGLVLCLINMLLNTLANSPSIEGVTNLAIWIVLCIMMVGLAFIEFFVVLFCMRHRKKQVDLMNQRISENGNAEGNEGNQTKRQVDDILDCYSLIILPILFTITLMVYFLICFKFESPDLDTVMRAKARFETMCARLW